MLGVRLAQERGKNEIFSFCVPTNGLIVGIPPLQLGSGFFQTGVRRRKSKLGPTVTKKFPVQAVFASLARVYISSSSPQSSEGFKIINAHHVVGISPELTYFSISQYKC